MADKIYVMQHGAIAQVGSFDHLIAEEGLFKSLYEKQRI
jgi:ABC-type multidrug transport system fused ATPase/permease subunit